MRAAPLAILITIGASIDYRAVAWPEHGQTHTLGSHWERSGASDSALMMMAPGPTTNWTWLHSIQYVSDVLVEGCESISHR